MAIVTAHDRPAWQVLRAMRERLRISQMEMSRRVGVTQSALSRWERTGRGLTEPEICQFGKLIEDRSNSQEESLIAGNEGADNGRVSARIRKALGMKQQEISDLSGISRTMLSMFENGYLELSSSDLENVVRILQTQVEQRGYKATKGRATSTANSPVINVDVSMQKAEHLFRPAKDAALRELEAQLKTYGDPVYRLKIAENEIERQQEQIKTVTDQYVAEKQALDRVEAENLDHKRHKELLGNFAAAQASLIALQHEKILALEGNPNRDFGKGVRSPVQVDTDIGEAQRKVNDCHQAIMAELERKTREPNSNT